MPAEVLAFTDGQTLLKVVFVHVLRQDESPDLATSCYGVREFELIGARLIVSDALLLTCWTVGP